MKRCVPSIILALVALAAPSRPAFADDPDADPWMARYDGGLLPAHASAWGCQFLPALRQHSLIRDGSGAVYVASTVWGTSDVKHVNLAKIGPEGRVLWSRLVQAGRTFGCPADVIITGGSVSLLTQGGVTGANKLRVSRFDSAGKLLGEVTYDGWFGRLVADSRGNAYLAASGGAEQGTLRRLDTTGAPIWTVRLGAADWIDALVASDSGVLVDTGSTLHRYSPTGELLWATPLFDGGHPTQLAPMPDGGFARAGFDFAGRPKVVRLDAAGQLLWTFVEGAASPWTGVAIGATTTGGVILATSRNYDWNYLGKSPRYLTRAFAEDGTTLWQQSVALGPDVGWNPSVVGLEVDAAGHSYVTGTYEREAEATAIIKYDDGGNVIWVAEAPGLHATAVAPVEGARLTLVGQTEIEWQSAMDLGLRVYDTASGAMLLSKDVTLSAPSADRPVGLAADVAGDIYVGGVSQGRSPGAGVVAKYDSQGVQQWVAEEPAPLVAVVTGGGPGVVVGATLQGASANAPRFHVVRYGPAGERLWAVDFPPPEARLHGELRALAADPAGNVYAAGYLRDECCYSGRNAVVKIGPGGNVEWMSDGAEGSARALTVDAPGNVYVSGGVTTKYDGNGQFVWEAQGSDCSGQASSAIALAVDDTGGVYVAGSSGSRDVVVSKYDASGAEMWKWCYDGPQHAHDGPIAVRIVPSGVVALARSASDYLTFELTQDGSLLWEERLDGGSYDLPSGLEVDAAGNVYITGTALLGSGADLGDQLTAKYDANGKLQWLERAAVNGTAGVLALTGDGILAVGGTTVNPATGVDIVTIGYSQDGSAQAPGGRPEPRDEPTVEDQLPAARPDEKRPPRKRPTGLYDRAPVETPEE